MGLSQDTPLFAAFAGARGLRLADGPDEVPHPRHRPRAPNLGPDPDPGLRPWTSALTSAPTSPLRLPRARCTCARRRPSSCACSSSRASSPSDPTTSTEARSSVARPTPSRSMHSAFSSRRASSEVSQVHAACGNSACARWASKLKDVRHVIADRGMERVRCLEFTRRQPFTLFHSSHPP